MGPDMFLTLRMKNTFCIVRAQLKVPRRSLVWNAPIFIVALRLSKINGG